MPKPKKKSKSVSRSMSKSMSKAVSKSVSKTARRSKRRSAAVEERVDDVDGTQGPAVRAFWSGTITFGLVSIPVDLLSAVRPRQTALKLVDKEGNALGRQYHCSKDGKPLDNDELVRGFETEDGEMVPITDEEFESVAPEMSSDIELRNFVPLQQIAPIYFQKSYFLAPAGKSSKAYNLLSATMERTSRVGIGSFVMRGHEYLVAIVSDNGVLRADTLRYADEIRTPEAIGLPKVTEASAKLIQQFAKEIDELQREELNLKELEDNEAEQLQSLVEEKQKDEQNVIHQTGLEGEEEEPASGGAEIIDLMAMLRKSLSKRAVVTNAERSAPISLDERRALKQKQNDAAKPAKKNAKSSKSKKNDA